MLTNTYTKDKYYNTQKYRTKKNSKCKLCDKEVVVFFEIFYKFKNV